VVGWDQARLAMVLAVLEARCGLALGGYDVYLNVAGGLRIGEPAADLAVAAALISSRFDRPVPAGMVVFGEIGLGGEVRAVGQVEQRLREAEKLGFSDALIPPLGSSRKGHTGTRMQLHPIDHLSKLVERLSRGQRSE
jgi:DNA repair protein RadA/Sms